MVSGGTIWVAGVDTHNNDAVLASYSTHGVLLTLTTTEVGGGQAAWNAMVMSGSNILVAGYAQTSSGPQYIAVGEYNTSGTLVSTFGTDGIVQTAAGGSSVGSAILVASNSIWVAGNADMTAVLVQYSPSGAFDQIIRSTIPENATWNAMTLAGSNILVAGYCNDGSMAIALSEYNVYGNLVSSFGAGGVVMTNVGTNATANAVMVETGGKILVTGTAQENYLHSDGSGYYQVELAMVQYQSDGALDPTFGSDGVALPFVTSGVTSDGYALTTLSNGNVAVAGQIEDSSSGHDIFVTEYSVATTPTSTYTYDVRNKMTGFSGATGTATYVYDDSGNRVRETTGGTTSFYLTDTANPTGYTQPIEVWTSTSGSLSSATLNTSYLIGDRVFGQDVGGTLSFLQVDGHGDTRLIANGTGTLINVLNYDAFGDALNFDTSAAPTIFLYPDGPLDPVSGLRMPGDGTRDLDGFFFLEMDFGGAGMGKPSDPISLHKYLYADADPINGNDPSGHNAAAFFAAEAGEAAFADVIYGFVEDLVLQQLQVSLVELGLIYEVTSADSIAPGMPTANDGYVQPARGPGSDGKRVKNPNGPGKGWIDNKGDVWVPTGTGPLAHGGPHWDVQHPGGGYINVYPGGATR
jgi:uncharacterized delta-60 repeat protein